MHKHDYWERIRATFLPLLGSLVADCPDLYAEGTTPYREFVGIVDYSEEEFEKVLHEIGAVRNPAAAWKNLFNSDETEEGSWAWRGHVHDGEFHANQFSDYQLHLILYDLTTKSKTAIFAHWEYSWITHPIKHYRGDYVDSKRGVELARQLFAHNEIEIVEQGDVHGVAISPN